MNFDFEEFVSSLHKRNPSLLSLHQLRDLLYLGDDYTRDSPTSTGKRLILNNISFWGAKNGSEGQSYSNSSIQYSKELSGGINIWVADNFKGKSSIFKIIKFALTGRNRIKPNVKKWLHQIILNFSINERAFTIYLNTERSLRGSLYNGTIRSLFELQEHPDDPLFTASSEAKYEKQIEDFFFKQFSYYSLKWTQKSSAKDRDELLEVGTSWVTYFDSIFLESKDSGSLSFGGQTKKIFQILLGLEFTYPINRLGVLRDKFMYDKAKQSTYVEIESSKQQDDEKLLNARLNEIESEISSLNAGELRIDTDNLFQKSDNLIKKIKHYNQEIAVLEEKLRDAKNQLNGLENLKTNRRFEKQRLQKEIQKTEKRIIDLNEFIQIGIFFSNLDIKQCPSCDHTITEKKKKAASHAKTCSLCSDPILEVDTVDKEDYTAKIENLVKYKDGLIKDLVSLEAVDDHDAYNLLIDEIASIEKQRNSGEDASAWHISLRDINDKLELEHSRPKPNKQRSDELIAEKAVISYRLKQLSAPKDVIKEDFDSRIFFLSEAIDRLNQERSQIGDKLLKRLASIMLEEINQLGLTSITEVEIASSLDIKYKQDGDFITFDDIAEGEQLRVKIAFYLSLIQLDIEYNFGRHTRFLIIDSPAKEEADATYMDGLSNVLKNIDARFGDSLQILIGTAERDLENVVPNQYVSPANEFIF